MMKPFLAAAAALLAAQPAFAAPLTTQSVYSDTGVSAAGANLGTVVYGTTISPKPDSPINPKPYTSATQITGQARIDQTKAYQDTSIALSQLGPAQGTGFDLICNTGHCNLTGTSGVNYINLTQAQANSIQFSLNVADTAITALIFNIPGVDAKVGEFQLTLPASLSPDKVLFNFYQAEKVSAGGKVVPGSILAPFATVGISGMQIKGAVVAFDLNAAGATVGGKAFILPGGGPAVPEPATWALLILGFGLVGAAMRRRVTAKPALAA